MRLTPKYQVSIVIYDEPDTYSQRYIVYLNQSNEEVVKEFLELEECLGINVSVFDPKIGEGSVSISIKTVPTYVEVAESIKKSLLAHFGENQINVVRIKR